MSRERGEHAAAPAAHAPGVPAPAVLLYDGWCPLCDGVVRAVLARDRRGVFRFAALRSRAAAERLAAGFAGELPDTVLLLEDGRVWMRSAAVVRILHHLGPPWALAAGVLWLVPRPLRDALYGWVARRRGAWFGRLPECRLPTPEERGRFLDAGETPPSADEFR